MNFIAHIIFYERSKMQTLNYISRWSHHCSDANINNEKNRSVDQTTRALIYIFFYYFQIVITFIAFELNFAFYFINKKKEWINKRKTKKKNSEKIPLRFMMNLFLLFVSFWRNHLQFVHLRNVYFCCSVFVRVKHVCVSVAFEFVSISWSFPCSTLIRFWT